MKVKHIAAALSAATLLSGVISQAALAKEQDDRARPIDAKLERVIDDH